MDLSLGRRADYAIRATLDLARHQGILRKAREVGEAMAVPASYLPQILALLVHAGIATSTAGPRGGYGLLRDPKDISLLDVVIAVDGEVQASQCVLRGVPCRWEDMCAVHLPWARAQGALTDELARTSFADLTELDRSLEAGELDLPAELQGLSRGNGPVPTLETVEPDLVSGTEG
jgi:Rrf2 family transcriptional regulator, iron-sulfur cluster assembly transcription factor